MEEKTKSYKKKIKQIMLYTIIAIFLLAAPIPFLMLFDLFTVAQVTSPVAPPPAGRFTAERIRIPIYAEGKDFPIAMIKAKKAIPLGIRFTMTTVTVDILRDNNTLEKQYKAVSAIFDQSKKPMTLTNVTIITFDPKGKILQTKTAKTISLYFNGKAVTETPPIQKQ